MSSENKPKYPDIEVQLVGRNGNAFAILGRVTHALRQAKVSKAEQDEFMAQAMSGDYDNLLNVCMQWITVT